MVSIASAVVFESFSHAYNTMEYTYKNRIWLKNYFKIKKSQNQMCKSQNSRAIVMVVFSAKYTHPNILDIGLQMQRSFRSVQVSLVLLDDPCFDEELTEGSNLRNKVTNQFDAGDKLYF